jgi:hypothetical protein
MAISHAARHSQAEERASVQAPLIHVLPALEGMQQASDAARLDALVHDVHVKLELSQVSIELLPAVHITHPSYALPLSPSFPLLVVPWGKRQVSLMSLYRQLHLEESRARNWDTLIRPEPAPAAVLPLSLLGGWSGTSNANLPRLVALCPGWDSQISVYDGQVFVLRGPDSLSPPTASSDLTRALRMFEHRGSDAQDDRQLYSTYLTHVLIASIEQVAAFLRAREEHIW